MASLWLFPPMDPKSAKDAVSSNTLHSLGKRNDIGLQLTIEPQVNSCAYLFYSTTAKNSETCSRAFSRCPFDSDTILIVFRAIGTSPALKSLSHPFPSHKLQPPKEAA